MMPTPARLPSVTLDGRHDAGRPSASGRRGQKGAYVQVINANNIGNREYVSAVDGTGNCYWGAERKASAATVGYADFN